MLKNITFSVEESIIQRARKIAQKEHKSLNEVFRTWLTGYAQKDNAEKDFQTLMSDLDYARAGKKFTREEMNAR